MLCWRVHRRTRGQTRYCEHVKSLGFVVVLAGCGFQTNPLQIAPIDGNDGVDPDAERSGPGLPDGSSTTNLPDAAIPIPLDAPAATTCFGVGVLTVCLDVVPTAPVTIASSTTPFDTSGAGCTQVVTQPAGPELCVIAGTSVTVTGSLVAVGARPLVLLGTDQITVTAAGVVDVSSRINPRRAGAGAGTGTCAAAGRGTSDSGGGGGGAGGSFGTTGGKGGLGNSAQDTAVGGGAPGAVQPTPTSVRGGCKAGVGGDGSGNATNPGGAAGDGGGGVYLIAGTKITIAGGVFASGAGGGANHTSAGRAQGGGGGGAGGMIGLDAPSINVTGRMAANGGAGGGGGALILGGNPGGDGTTTSQNKRAIGGAPDVGAGAGADGTAQGLTTTLDGASALRAGGGGAGGLGYVLTYGALQGTLISPAPIQR